MPTYEELARDETFRLEGGYARLRAALHYPQMLRDEVLVRLEKPERLTASTRLIIPDSAKRADFEMYQATVLACGPGRRRKDGKINPIEVKPGDKCLIYWGGIKIKMNERMESGSVNAVLNGEDVYIVSEWAIQMAWPGHLTLKEAING